MRRDFSSLCVAFAGPLATDSNKCRYSCAIRGRDLIEKRPMQIYIGSCLVAVELGKDRGSLDTRFDRAAMPPH